MPGNRTAVAVRAIDFPPTGVPDSVSPMMFGIASSKIFRRAYDRLFEFLASFRSVEKAPVHTEKDGDTSHLIHRDLREAVRGAPATSLTLDVVRSLRDAIAQQVASADVASSDDPIAVESTAIAGCHGSPDVRILVLKPRTQAPRPRPGILHMHGGDYVVGCPEWTLPVLRQTAAKLDCVIVSVDYRLSPEAKFPAALNDCYAALEWMVERHGELGIDPMRIAVMGESAGGGLAAATAVLARDRNGPPIAFQSLLYPMLDDRTATVVHPDPSSGQFVWTAGSNIFAWTQYLHEQPGSFHVSPYSAPARLKDFIRLPPAHILVGTLDLFADENINYAHRLLRAGVPIDLDVIAGAYHGFDSVPHARPTIDAMNMRLSRLSYIFYQ